MLFNNQLFCSVWPKGEKMLTLQFT